jgi:hypothetical protein
VLPGPDVQILDAAPGAGAQTDTATAFMAGLADRGKTSDQLTTADAVTSLADFTTKFGPKQTYNTVEYDAVEAFFAEGGARLYFSRKAGPAKVKAQANVPTVTPKFTAIAKSVGAWANNLTVTVASGVITIRENGVLVETSPTLADVVAAQTWSASSSYIDITPVGTGALTDSAAVALTGGADDRTNITDTQIQAALDRFGKELGPGQVMLPGDTRAAAHTMLATHARDRNRFAYGDPPDTPTVATITALGTGMRAQGRELARHIQIFDQWYQAPGSSPGSTRLIAPSAVQAGLAARVDAGGNPNVAVAGPRAVSRLATGLKYARTDADREALANAGVTAIIAAPEGIQPYDDVTPVDPVADPEWLGAAGNRFVMRAISDSIAIARAHMFNQNSGPADLGDVAGDVKGMLAGWRRQRALFSRDGTAESAFRVDLSANTPTTAEQRKLIIGEALRISPNNRQVVVQITNVPLTAAL